MNNTNTQDGSQTPGSTQPTSLPPSGGRNVANSDQREICRNYEWGTCTKGAACRFRHVFDYEHMKETLKFCHDYQNHAVCSREGCTYLHTTKEEQTLFFSTGKLPLVLKKRYAKLSKGETIQQIASYIKEVVPNPAIPPPPPSAPSQPAVAKPMGSVPAQATPMGPMHMPRRTMGAMHPTGLNMGPMMSMPSIVAPPPPMHPIQHLPPPPPPPTQSSTTTPNSAPPTYTAPGQSGIGYAVNQTSSSVLPAKFDASKPPPPLPHIQNGNLKRTSQSEMEAGPSKLRKEREGPGDEARCEYCQQRQLRIDIYKQEIEKMNTREKLQILIYKKKLEDCQKRKEILKTLLSPDLYKLLEDFLDESPPLPNQVNQNEIPNDRQLIVQLFNLFMNNGRPAPSRNDERIRSLLSTKPDAGKSLNTDTILSFMKLLGAGTKPPNADKSNENNNVSSNGMNDYTYGRTSTNADIPAPFNISVNASVATTICLQQWRDRICRKHQWRPFYPLQVHQCTISITEYRDRRRQQQQNRRRAFPPLHQITLIHNRIHRHHITIRTNNVRI
ncbi:unnamed protein product [Leptosia nina]|uniref:C3H1-type domain-containing protein n=1 Tax=Leptosia nina TaxID=320188 RepID=A0AAV1JXD0_9NEOP